LGRLIVESITNVNTFVAVQSGDITISGWGLIPGAYYVVDETGNGTLTEYSAGLDYNFSNPVLQAITSTYAHVLPWRASAQGVLKGTPGTSGTSGLGFIGTSGTSGTVGATGTSGTSGTVGATGTSGTSGANGSSGTSGNGVINSIPASNSVDGIKANLSLGETVVFGDVLYLKSDGLYYKASALSGTTMPSVAIAAAAITGGTTGTTLLQGYINKSTWTWTSGNLLYVSLTGGTMTNTTSNFVTGQQIQILGYAVTGTTMYFNPNYMIIEHA
jgi:hypothetical protein